MNSFESFLARHPGYDATATMNLLQSHGVVSDCAAPPADVSDADSDIAIVFLHQHAADVFQAGLAAVRARLDAVPADVSPSLSPSHNSAL